MNFKIDLRHLVVRRYLKQSHRSLQYNLNISSVQSFTFHLLLELVADSFLTHFHYKNALPKKTEVSKNALIWTTLSTREHIQLRSCGFSLWMIKKERDVFYFLELHESNLLNDWAGPQWKGDIWLVPLAFRSASFTIRTGKGRFTRYDFVAYDKLTTGLRHELFRENQTYNLLTTVVYVKKNVVGFWNMF